MCLTLSYTESSMSSLRIIQHKRLSKDEVRIVDTSVKVLNGTGKHRQVSVTRRQSSMQRQTSSSLHQVLEDAHTTTRTESPDVFDDLHRCASPTEETEETECSGFNCDSSYGHDGADVVCGSQLPCYRRQMLTMIRCSSRWRPAGNRKGPGIPTTIHSPRSFVISV